MDIFARFDADKLRLSLKMAASRLEIKKNQRLAEMAKQKVEIANLLRDPTKEELARIRTEHFVRDDRIVEVYGILSLVCQLMQERVKLLASVKDIPYDMREPCATVCYAADRAEDVPELAQVKKQLVLKFGKGITDLLATEEAASEFVNARVMEKLSIKPPPALIVTSYMKAIAKEKNVEWNPGGPVNGSDDADWNKPMPAPKGKSETGVYPDLVFPPPGVGRGVGFTGLGGAAGDNNDDDNDDDDAFQPPPSPPRGKPAARTQSQQAKPAPTFTRGPAPPPPPPPPPATVSAASAFPGLDDEDLFVPPKPKPAPRGAAPAARAAQAPPQIPGDSGEYHPVQEGASAIPDFDELSRRFEALKRG